MDPNFWMKEFGLQTLFCRQWGTTESNLEFCFRKIMVHKMKWKNEAGHWMTILEDIFKFQGKDRRHILLYLSTSRDEGREGIQAQQRWDRQAGFDCLCHVGKYSIPLSLFSQLCQVYELLDFFRNFIFRNHEFLESYTLACEVMKSIMKSKGNISHYEISLSLVILRYLTVLKKENHVFGLFTFFSFIAYQWPNAQNRAQQASCHGSQWELRSFPVGACGSHRSCGAPVGGRREQVLVPARVGWGRGGGEGGAERCSMHLLVASSTGTPAHLHTPACMRMQPPVISCYSVTA